MKQLRIVLPLLALVILMIPAIVLAQDVTEGGVTLLEALGLVHDAYGDEIIIVKASYNDDDACWKFEFEDGTEVCVDEVTGEILVDDSPEITPEPEETPEMEETPEPDDDDDMDDVDDDVNDDEDEDVNDDVNDDDEDVTPTVTMEDAIAIALSIFPDSQVSDINLDHMHGLLVWDIGLDDNTRAVDIDAMTGAVLFFGFESQDDDSYVSSDDDSSDDDHGDDSGDDDHEDDDHGDDSSDDSHDDSSNDSHDD